MQHIIVGRSKNLQGNMQWKYRLFHGFIDDIMKNHRLYKLTEFNMPKENTYSVDDILNTYNHTVLKPSSENAIWVKLNLPGLSIIFCQNLQCGLGNFFEPSTRIANARITGTSSVNTFIDKSAVTIWEQPEKRFIKKKTTSFLMLQTGTWYQATERGFIWKRRGFGNVTWR